MRAAAAVALLLTGCVAVPPPAPRATLGGCHPGAYGARSDLRCERDADCLRCGDPDARCGRLTSRARIALTNAPCPRPDARACPGAAARCCGGRCVLSLGPPPL
ncbi:MAG TPA: hypothetical protein RMH99_15325 [Sandaracinaceae bacterium LLY-WYZ-13_1]|nr:hypothetical protein [Sandaracinaceae bacterium LLY-WYZ-13_1]